MIIKIQHNTEYVILLTLENLQCARNPSSVALHPGTPLSSKSKSDLCRKLDLFAAMAARRRTPMRKARAGPAKSRVIKLLSMEQWERLSEKIGNALIFVYIVTVVSSHPFLH